MALVTATLNNGHAPPVCELYFGGAGDAQSRIVVDYVEQRSRQHAHEIYHFEHAQFRAAASCASYEYSLGHRIIFVAHSWGCDTALRVAKMMTTPIDLLIGVDPVAKPFPLSWLARKRPANIARIVHVDALPDWSHRSDLVKAVGKVLGGGIPAPYREADTTLQLTACHGAFSTMMRTPGPTTPSAEGLLDAFLTSLAV